MTETGGWFAAIKEAGMTPKKVEKVDPVELAIANLAKLRKKDSKTLTSAETSWVFIYAPFVDEIVRLRETISDQGW